MSGNPEYTSVWGDASVYVAPLGTALPTDIDDDFPVGWELVGYLDGSAGMPESRSRSETDHSAWGAGIIKRSYKDALVEVMFTALEDNEVVKSLAYVVGDGGDSGKLKYGNPTPMLFANELTELSGRKRRRISAGEANIVTTGNIENGEDSLEKFPLKAACFPDEDGWHFIEQRDEEGS